ncbi:hypothetical protein ACT3TY_10150 [Halomonas sp. AOP22-C1-8]|uniref:hypothetical protein n=1 Tax=Halomonas sp. AOP22-C1-8 TaxID=3457717 RepID=UPI004034EAA5
MKIGNNIAQHQSFSDGFYLIPILIQMKLAEPNNKLNKFLAESLINLSLRAQVFVQDEMTCEFRLASSYFKVQRFLQKHNLKSPTTLYYYERFAQGHFMDINSINGHLRGFFEE